MTTLVVIRGNSASGKSTVAAGLQRRFEHGHCAVIGQDVVRRQIVRERDEPGGWNIELIEHIATLCLARGMVTIVEGILDADRYGAMLHRLADTAGCATPLRLRPHLRRNSRSPCRPAAGRNDSS